MSEDIKNIKEMLNEDKINLAIDFIKSKLTEKNNEDFIENLINNLSHFELKTELITKVLFSDLIKLLNFLKDDVLRYSLLLVLKSTVEKEPDLLVNLASDYLRSENPNAREGILVLLIYSANKNPEKFKSFIEEGIELLADKEDFVQKKAVDFLSTLGKKYYIEIEKALIEKLETNPKEQFKENGELVLKKMIDLKNLQEEELKKKKIESIKKELDKKETEIAEVEIEITKETLKKKEKEQELKEKEKELIKKEQEIKEKELKE